MIIGRYLANLLNSFHPSMYAPKYGMFAIQPLSRRQRDEKLAAICIWSTKITIRKFDFLLHKAADHFK